MTHILFYEKTGCINNTKQKKLLAEAGYQVEARDLLNESWSREALARYFGNMPVADRFNQSAPQVTSGAVVPQQLDEETAYELMIAEPILIRRPLMKIGEHYLVGFNEEQVNNVLTINLEEKAHGDLEACPRTSGHSCDENQD